MICRLFVSCILFLAFPGDAAAFSCSPFQSRYVFQCDAERCTGLFNVRDAPGSGTCTRRPVVEAIDARVATQATRLVEAARPGAAPGLYELKMSKSYWSGEAGDPRAWFDADARSAVTLLGADASPDRIAALRRDYEAAEKTAFWHATLVSIAFWVSSIIALLALMFSVYMYFRRLRGRASLWMPVALQLLVAGIGVAMALMSLFGPFWPGVLLVPAVPVILAVEGVALLLRKRPG